MRRVRLRPQHSPERLAEIYAVRHDHTHWEDHKLRVSVTTQVARWMVSDYTDVVADLSCGDGAIANGVPALRHILGDMAEGVELVGPIEATVRLIPKVNLFICSESIEHLDDPNLVLTLIREKTAKLVLSTPVGCFNDPNEEHYWAWDREAVEKMLADAGFQVSTYLELSWPCGGYTFGIWGCV